MFLQTFRDRISSAIEVVMIDKIIGRERNIIILYCPGVIDTTVYNIDQWVKIALTRAQNSLFICCRELTNPIGGPEDQLQVIFNV